MTEFDLGGYAISIEYDSLQGWTWKARRPGVEGDDYELGPDLEIGDGNFGSADEAEADALSEIELDARVQVLDGEELRSRVRSRQAGD